jgi:hypothetical protein
MRRKVGKMGVMYTRDEKMVAASVALSEQIRVSGYIGAFVGAEVGKPDGGLVVYHQHESAPLVGDEYMGFSVRVQHTGPIQAAEAK